MSCSLIVVYQLSWPKPLPSGDDDGKVINCGGENTKGLMPHIVANSSLRTGTIAIVVFL